MRNSCRYAGLITVLILGGPSLASAEEDAPRALDARLVVERFAAAPDIVHPVSMTFDRRGRLLVIESHTHFRPANYQGPPHDRVRVLEDTDGDGKADRFTTFFEGTRATMDIATHPDGSVYLATRNEVLRLRDTDGDGRADERQRIVFLDTRGDYPHNGLSGLTFDARGNLYFGMGENLGASYRLVGSDGTALADEGEGGNIFWCTADGRRLRRVATGFWNPFGTCLDIFGRLFAVDNDPDAMPPCRLLHVVEGGDYGYQFRYGRSGRHPFQAWDGQLPGTLPMVAGTGEGPCEVVSYEAEGLPAEYRGSLLVTAWADHRVERYQLADKGASVVGQRLPFVQGGKDFRPVGLAVATDGSLFVSDWVLRDYNLHGRGAVWHVRSRTASKADRATDARIAFTQQDRTVRDEAARTLAAEGETGRAFLREQARAEDVRRRAAALTALIAADDRSLDLQAVAARDPVGPLRALAVRALAERGADVRAYTAPEAPPAVQREAVAGLRSVDDRPRLLELLASADPFLRQAAIRQLSALPALLGSMNLTGLDAQQRQGVLLAQRAAGRVQGLPQLLADPDPEVRFLAAKWIADQKLTAYEAPLDAALKDPGLSLRLHHAYASALARVRGQEVNEGHMADFFLTRVTDPGTPPALRVAALRLVPATHKKLTVNLLRGLLEQDDVGVQREAVRLLSEHPDPRRLPVLHDLMRDPRLRPEVRAEAVVGAAARPEEAPEALLALAEGEDATLRAEALRALANVKLTASQRAVVERTVQRHPAAGDLAARVLGQAFAKARPKPADTAAWLQRLEGPADAAAGRRIFFQPRLGHCARCHRVDGRGADIGPDLSGIGRSERRQLVESLLQPSANVAPHYQVWSLVLQDGKVRTGMLVKTYLDEYTYVDPQGNLFTVTTRDVQETLSLATSIMPDGLADLFTDQELRDLLAYLASLR